MMCPNCNRKSLRKISHIFIANNEILFYSMCICGFYWFVYDNKLFDNYYKKGVDVKFQNKNYVN